MSIKVVLRYLRYQKQCPRKFVRASKGGIFYAVVDLRTGNKTYGKWYGV